MHVDNNPDPSSKVGAFSLPQADGDNMHVGLASMATEQEERARMTPSASTYEISRALGEGAAPIKKEAFLPADAAARKGIPITTGVFDYFPRALAYIAMISKAGNDQHNPGQPLHWAREKSTDHADCIGRHLIERGTRDLQDNLRHSGKLGWRSLANLELELEAAEKNGESW